MYICTAVAEKAVTTSEFSVLKYPCVFVLHEVSGSGWFGFYFGLFALLEGFIESRQPQAFWP